MNDLFCISCFFPSLLVFYLYEEQERETALFPVGQHSTDWYRNPSVFLEEAWKGLPPRNPAIPLRITPGLCYNHPTTIENSTRRTLSCWSVSREEQQDWWRVCRTSLMRSSWGNWDCLVWKRGGWGGILLPSTAAWKKVVVRWVLASSRR